MLITELVNVAKSTEFANHLIEFLYLKIFEIEKKLNNCTLVEVQDYHEQYNEILLLN